MNKDNFDQDSLRGRELTDEELTQIQGGGFWGEVWNEVKKVGQVVVDVIDVITGKKPFPSPFPKRDPRIPYPPGRI